ncbi:polyphosphate:nucleotide phosphotransferase, PPK2 family [Actinokineospora alba]|uniref:Polyphosphate:nucleotide phosphotransferase, PPK2 family n=1 Tax=Actinokineospora alba TaxID=504798 RepID=A0A1H0U0K7_9PSEU|nr:PPK2 family polyphosphate kinase [Actinokineospora alba]TDP70835.1 PPK2 family polyphosphate:nucleotide phosphotransferase [Actinokineospora alba]SDJ17685.1 polyphosphate:nucleotide phosphotransferase, PPK2 family [Actinokineospora alba]SDP59787.1 polyphosphate:nucleotide phosphotransferase, PPK2 family [Actinokineospora alba]
MAKKQGTSTSVRDALRVRAGGAIPHAPRDTPVGPSSKVEAAAGLVGTGAELAGLQEALWAEGTFGGGERSVLLVLQGMDTSGKGGTIEHVFGLMNPQGVRVASFKKPTPTEKRNHFLWRIRKQVPAAGLIGVFDRSHYEDVLVVRVDELVPPAKWEPRYDEINEFEAELAAAGTTVVKCFLNISAEEQRERLLARLETPEKQWKYNPSDLDVRAKWGDYEQAYADVLDRCSTEDAPWYAIPADRKWYRNWAIAQILLETLRDLDPKLPEPAYDVAAELKRLKKNDPLLAGAAE